MKEINVFVLGSKGYTANYGGWETFVHGLIDNRKDPGVSYYVFEIVHSKSEEEIVKADGLTRIRIFVKKRGSSTMMIYDAKCTAYALNYIKENGISNPVLLYLGMRIGPLVWLKKPGIKKQGIRVIENPDGMEWKRTKWNVLARMYLYISAHFMSGAADCLICDSEKIRDIYDRMPGAKKVRKEYIPYGACPVEELPEPVPDRVRLFFDKWKIRKDGYYLILGRYTPENNYEMMIRGFMASSSARDLLVITNYSEEKPSFHKHIKESTQYGKDARVKMAGTVYDSELLKYIRKYAHGYIHGHKVGGTNPGLLEAMSVTDVNILFDSRFNREVGGDAAMYFADAEELSGRIEEADGFLQETIHEYGTKAREHILKNYSWDDTIRKYERLFYEVTQDGYKCNQGT